MHNNNTIPELTDVDFIEEHKRMYLAMEEKSSGWIKKWSTLELSWGKFVKEELQLGEYM